ncbi:hypothetical protein [Streptomyces sp. HPF1205]|uniref:hypothetical protein n=1 Tax=Streptomyces sp. HPF1205 TaxID=2873262 RepID=UPI001CEDFC7E|nr:hypothetical protein [Streptomyces sp. HPF1205]
MKLTGGGTGTELVGLPRDWAAGDLNESTATFSANMVAPDVVLHGVTVQRITGTPEPAATPAPGAASKQTL